MLPNLTIIISVYCGVRLLEMSSSPAVTKTTPKQFAWAFFCVAAIAIIGYFCLDTVRRSGPDPLSSAPQASAPFSERFHAIFDHVDSKVPQ